jgi:hypothetical protein
MDAGARSPGEVSRSRCPSIDTGRAADKDDNCVCWLHTPHASCHRLLGVVHAGSASGPPGTAVSHRAEEGNLDQKSGQPSMANPHEGEHNLREEPCALQEVGEQEQIRSCVLDQDEADVPTPGASSTPIGIPPANTPVPRQSDYTNGRGPARCLRLRVQARNAPRCRYSSTTSVAVNARCGKLVKKSS